MAEEPAVRVTLLDIWRQGQETKERVAALSSTVETLADQRRELDELERRVRVVEQTQAAFGAPASPVDRRSLLLAGMALLVSLMAPLVDLIDRIAH